MQASYETVNRSWVQPNGRGHQQNKAEQDRRIWNWIYIRFTLKDFVDLKGLVIQIFIVQNF